MTHPSPDSGDGTVDSEVLGRVRQDSHLMALAVRKSFHKTIHHQQLQDLRRLAEDVLDLVLEIRD